MTEVVHPLLQIFVFVLVGLLCRNLNILDLHSREKLSSFVFNIVLPCMLFTSAARTDFQVFGEKAAVAFGAGLLIPLPAFLIGQIAARIGRATETQSQVIRVGAALSNTAFFGIPICAALWGDEGALLAGFYDQGITIPMFILGPIGYAVRPNLINLRAAFLNPIILSMAFGIAVSMSGLQLPDVLFQPLELIGQMTTPLALMIVGALLDTSALREASPAPLMLLASTRMLLVPMLVLGAVLLLKLDKSLQQVIVIQAAMPTSVIGTIMAFQYHSDERLAVQGNLLTVMISLLTVSLFVALLSL
jgi:malate permease and related proteins